jgi:hypothetical protein
MFYTSRQITDDEDRRDEEEEKKKKSSHIPVKYFLD